MIYSTSKFFLAGAVCVATAAPAMLRAQQTADPLPAAPSSVLQQQVVKEKELSKNAGSGAKFTPAATVKTPQGEMRDTATADPRPLSLDDAISYALVGNHRVKYDLANLHEVQGLQSTVLSAIIPNLTLQASSSAQQINLAAMGFKPALLGEVGSLLNVDLSNFSTIVRINVTQAQIGASQQLFNLPDLELYRAAKSERQVVDFNYLNSRGNVVTAVGTAYLQVIADRANLENAKTQEVASKRTFDDAFARRNAGVGTNLDALRAQVDYQQRQQTTVAQAAQVEKDIIQLNRIMGVPAEQQWEFTDAAPFAEFVDLTMADAMSTALLHRKDFLSLEAQIDVQQREYKAVKYQRLPTLAFKGFYGVIGETTGLYHGVFNAQGSLQVPVFREAAQRGEQQQISAALMGLRDREASLRTDMEAQIRMAMLDEQAANELVKVTRSKVELSNQELADERDRFAAGVDDNLPVIDAQASVTSAQAELVQALYKYNVAKLNLAQATGVVESRYRTYLGTELATTAKP
ncbi:TolC family protein [Granulicella cerasi]|uniref:TolC family protein n=1 Tax=Granulicella cerasi TaxID=741063 RepID=A0ABW1Z6F9_9BACT|nr:TolC family protein [Granulicella cerasi]